ncbi:MAG: hypothetical protein A2787_06750 [Omnitrophica WOR_2 bacterium RIFCSPHIGHO2_01_FULL_48_9]|nr:MAG: hypothetical protein A3D10_09535 [Omnitrophica WOR_2 bacterium RIFCSPHIGHO2_02_FULL_48_11]OGX29963.1 MAG: hypothetical protein A2787_06750 [Omnitrophica WOR_2 bacterium RIFCSPHIGHO2_01_FULL_48_9]
MKKYLLVTAVLVGAAFLTSCGQGAKEDETSSEVDKMLEQMETASTTEQAAAVAPGVPGTAAVTPAVPLPEAPLAAGPFEKPAVQSVQQALQNAGLYQGKVDGTLGPKTKKAIIDFQTQSGLTVDGKVGPKTWQKLSPYLNSVAQSAVAADPAAAAGEISN